MENSIFWLFYIILIFWSIYQKWDEKQEKYISHPHLTSLYFLGASSVLLIFFPHALSFFTYDIIGIFIFIGIILFTYIVYKVLRLISNQESNWFFYDYIQLLDSRFILPKLFEIIFQQIAFVSVLVLAISSFGEAVTLLATVFVFVLAHLNLFLFRSIRESVFYLLFSIIGAPIFVLLLINTESLWYSISVHMLFYTLLAMSAWSWGVIKSGK